MSREVSEMVSLRGASFKLKGSAGSGKIFFGVDGEFCNPTLDLSRMLMLTKLRCLGFTSLIIEGNSITAVSWNQNLERGSSRLAQYINGIRDIILLISSNIRWFPREFSLASECLSNSRVQ
uniref:Uncharacterized protein n=1 Tax=Nelumbo nucifera TaxID=4432 RepID=A0A822ZNY7_NELNU|nr:TPA_asm: hypothetical protein HUJ06_002866 [Nelumbo nucifera]